MGQLQSQIEENKRLAHEIESRDHTIGVMGDHNAQLRSRDYSLQLA